jgi:hypothetical protein
VQIPDVFQVYASGRKVLSDFLKKEQTKTPGFHRALLLLNQ